MNLQKVNEEVFIAQDAIVRMGDEEVAFLKRQAEASPRKRARICAHRSNDDTLHEMLIAISSRSYIRPHRHISKSESFHIVEGEVDVAVFDEAGAVKEVIQLGAPGSGRRFFYRLSQSAFHTLLIRSDCLVMHEVTNGPFSREGTIQAPFAPDESDADAALAYMARLDGMVAQHMAEHTA